MIAKIVKQVDRKKDFSVRENRTYRSGTIPEARMGVREFLCGQHHGSSERLQRSTRIFTGNLLEYGIVGVYALGFRGVPRYAGGTDLFFTLNAPGSNRLGMAPPTGKMTWGRDSGYFW
jgi:hypothetical protein